MKVKKNVLILCAPATNNMAKDLTNEQLKDYILREKEVLDFLKEKQITLSVSTQSVHLGKNIFALQAYPHLSDLKFQEKPAEQEKPKTKEEAVKEILESEVKPAE